MRNELVSIIVPIYNVEKYLDRCLLSIKNQTYENIEVIMVNDGSKDSSKIIAERYQNLDRRFHLFDKENGGLSSGRNFGLQFIKGKYVSFIDSDDFLTKEYVETLVESFDENVDIVIGDYVIFNDNTKKAYIHGNSLKKEDFYSKEDKKRLINSMIQGYPVMSVWKNMYRVEFLEAKELRFISERIVYSEDFLFHVEAYSEARSIRVIPDIVFNHLVVPGSLSQGYRKNYFEMNKELFSRVKLQLEKYYDKVFVEEYSRRVSEMIGASMFALCKCSFKEAISNINHMLNDDFVKNTYRLKQTGMGYKRYILLYELGKLNSSMIVVSVAKLMQLMNPIYRFFQRKKEYIPKVVS